MKLTQAQIKALAEEIVNTHFEEIIKPVIDHNNIIKKSREFIEFPKKDKKCIELKDLIPPHEKGGLTYAVDKIVEKLREKAFSYKLKIEPKKLSYSQVVNAITVATIDSSDLKDLIKSIKEKFWGGE